MNAALAFGLYLALVTAAGLSYPRRPRLSGVLFLALGIWSAALGLGIASARPEPGFLSRGAGVAWCLLGLWYLVKFRHPAARARHVDYWTEKT